MLSKFLMKKMIIRLRVTTTIVLIMTLWIAMERTPSLSRQEIWLWPFRACLSLWKPSLSNKWLSMSLASLKSFKISTNNFLKLGWHLKKMFKWNKTSWQISTSWSKNSPQFFMRTSRCQFSAISFLTLWPSAKTSLLRLQQILSQISKTHRTNLI